MAKRGADEKSADGGFLALVFAKILPLCHLNLMFGVF
jgi:hypothetical protein